MEVKIIIIIIMEKGLGRFARFNARITSRLTLDVFFLPTSRVLPLENWWLPWKSYNEREPTRGIAIIIEIVLHLIRPYISLRLRYNYFSILFDSIRYWNEEEWETLNFFLSRSFEKYLLLPILYIKIFSSLLQSEFLQNVSDSISLIEMTLFKYRR